MSVLSHQRSQGLFHVLKLTPKHRCSRRDLHFIFFDILGNLKDLKDKLNSPAQFSTSSTQPNQTASINWATKMHSNLYITFLEIVGKKRKKEKNGETNRNMTMEIEKKNDGEIIRKSKKMIQKYMGKLKKGNHMEIKE